MSEYITLNPLSVLLPGQSFVNEKNCVSLQLNFTATGGSFSISVLKDSAALPPEDFVITLPFGRFGVVKGTGKTRSTGGLLDTISGPMVPLQATNINFTSIVPVFTLGTPGFKTTSQLARSLMAGVTVNWQSIDPFLRTFAYRGVALQGVQQLASVVLGDLFIYKNQVYVVPPGKVIGGGFSVPNSDVVSFSQNVDFTNDFLSVLNPVLNTAQLDNRGDFKYDDQHARKQGNQNVTCGAVQGTGGTDFAPIPDGWMIEGTFDEWVPTGTDLSNPPSNGSSRYWKVFQSPTNPGALRGVLTWTRLVKDLKLNPQATGPFQTLQSIQGNVSTFVGSPVTTQTLGYGSPQSFILGNSGTAGGIFGATCESDLVLDIVSGQSTQVQNSLVLQPSGIAGGDSGPADTYYYSIVLGFWTFPRVSPTTFGTGDPTNPFGLPPDVVIVNPNSNVIAVPPQVPQAYWNDYLVQFRKINSPRLKTQVSCVFRNIIPQPGDALTLPAADEPQCGRIESVTLNYTRGGITINIQAQVFAFGVPDSGIWRVTGMK